MPGAEPIGAVLLIHGAWQGSWVWNDFAPLLSQAGFTVDAVDLPGNGVDHTPPREVSLDLYVRFLSDRIDRLSGPVVVIGHSGGGVVASQLAEDRPGRVRGLIYLAGMMLPSGMTFGGLLRDLGGDPSVNVGIGAHLIWSEDGRVSTVPPDAAAKIFLNDLDPDVAVEVARRLTPQGEGGRNVSATLTSERFGRVPRLYVEALNDQSVVLAAQRRMQALTPGADVVSLPTGHAPHVVAPRLTADAILPWILAPVGATPTG